MATNLIGIVRCLLAFLGLSAVATEIIALINRGNFNPANFFSFFTIQSNILSIAMFALFAYVALTKRPIAQQLYVFKGAVTLYMLMTGLIFAALLAPLENAVLTAVPWDNIVLHYIIPVAVVLDWLCLHTTVKISFHQSLIWLSFPAIYVIYTLIRGYFVNWYPYPFLDPTTKGYGTLVITSGVLLILVLVASQLVRITPGRLANNGK